jgi:MATE family multidrug resistance protein
MPAGGLGIAGATLVGHSLGAEEKENAHIWGWEVVRVSVIILATIGLPLWIAPEFVLRLFTPDQALIDLGATPLRILGLGIGFEVAAIIFTQTLLSAGASKQVMLTNLLMQWVIFLPLAWLLGPTLGFGLTGIWLLQAAQRITLSLIYGAIWHKRHWAHINV